MAHGARLMEGSGMASRRTQWLLGALAAAGIVAGGIALKHRGAAPNEASTPAPAAAIQPPRPAAAAQAVQPATGAPAVSVPAGDEPIAVQLERLAATGAPNDAFAAYLLVMNCAAFNHQHNDPVFDEKMRAFRQAHPQQGEHDARVCAGMTERQWQARLDYLAFAAGRGVPLAVWSFAHEGPFGDPSALKTRPDDPLVRDWKARATAQLTQSAEAGEPLTLMMWGLEKMSGSDLAPRDPVRGYTYLLATSLIGADRYGPSERTAQLYGADSPLMTIFAANLTPEQRAAATAAARRIADEARARRQRQG
jgi:hypothetical protein